MTDTPTQIALLETILVKLDGIENRLDKVEGRLESIESRLSHAEALNAATQEWLKSHGKVAETSFGEVKSECAHTRSEMGMIGYEADQCVEAARRVDNALGQHLRAINDTNERLLRGLQ